MCAFDERGAIHADVVLVPGQILRRLQLAGVPAGGLLGRILHQPLEDSDVVFHVRLDKADQRAGLVAQLAQHGIDDLDVASRGR